jgi:Uncharacterized protein conserved in bacteria
MQQIPAQTPTEEQLRRLKSILASARFVSEALGRAQLLNLENYYIGAGCIAQTVWNDLSDNPLEFGIKDIDFVYFDSNLDPEAEDKVIARAKELFSGLGTEVDVKNQARVHLWYEAHFGYGIRPYDSLEAAIRTWPTTATAIGIRKQTDGSLKVYAPFGLEDLFAKTVRPNKAQITKEIYEHKVTNWLSKWPDLKIIPWDE